MRWDRKRTILLYGRTRAGKTTLIGELAEHVYRHTKKKTRLYTTDRGGVEPLLPYLDLGIIEVISHTDEMGHDTDPFIFLDRTTKGHVRSAKGWVPGVWDGIGLVAFESLTAHGDQLMAALAERAAAGLNVGGEANVQMTITGEDGTALKIGGNNRAHYSVVQSVLLRAIWASQKLPVPIVLWTASASKEDDGLTTTKIIGPAAVGRALTAELPRTFSLTFRVDAVPGAPGKPERHLLYLGNSIDVGAGQAVGLGNTRVPLDGHATVPAVIEPASLVKALEAIDQGAAAAIASVKSRLGL